MRYLLAISILLLSLNVMAQPPGISGINLIQNKPLYFSYNTAEDLLNPQVITNAFELKFNSGANNLIGYAQIIFNSIQGRQSFNSQLVMRTAFRSSSNAMIPGTDIPLTNAPVMLFSQPGTNNSAGMQHSFVYDLILKPFTNFVKPDLYNYSIMITITPE